MIAASVILPPGERVRGACDSKLLTPKQRDEIAAEIYAKALAVSIAAATASTARRARRQSSRARHTAATLAV